MTEDIYYTSPDGLTLFARRYGPENAPLTALCMHGLTRNHKDFEPLIEALDGRYQFIAVDQRGRGQSDRDPVAERYTPQTYVGDMKALLDRLGLQKVVLIGTSMGGLMSMIMMRTMPARIRGVVLNDVDVTRRNAAYYYGYYYGYYRKQSDGYYGMDDEADA